MPCVITLKNYRCFSDKHPCRIELKDGFTFSSFIGVNNAGKSTILRFFFEFRDFLTALGLSGRLGQVLNDSLSPINHGPHVGDPLEVFYKGNDRPLVVEIVFTDWPPADDAIAQDDQVTLAALDVPPDSKHAPVPSLPQS